MNEQNKPYRISHRDELGNLLNDLELFGEGAEIGVYRGEYAYQLLSTWQGKLLHLVDPWRSLDDYPACLNDSDEENEFRLRETMDRLKDFSNRFRVHRELSRVAANNFQESGLDFVYIDANHDYEHVREDLTLWYPKVRQGGIFAGHDYFDSEDGIFGVKKAVEEFALRHHLSFHTTEEQYPTWYIFK